MLPQQKKNRQKIEIVNENAKKKTIFRIENLPLSNPVVVDKTYHPLQTAKKKRKKIWKLI